MEEIKINNIIPEICELWKGETFIGIIKNELELNDVLIQYKMLNFDTNVYQIKYNQIVYPILRGGRIPNNFNAYELFDKQLETLLGF